MEIFFEYPWILPLIGIACLVMVIKIGRSRRRARRRKHAKQAEQRDKARRQRQHIKRSRLVKEHGEDLVVEMERWDQFAEETRFMVAAYEKKGQITVDVIDVLEAEITGKRKKELALLVAAPKKDPYLDDALEWEREFRLPISKLVYHEPLHRNFYDDGLEAYKRAVRRGMAAAEKL